MPYTTKEFLKKVNISEATLRRWISEKSWIWACDREKKRWKDASASQKALGKLILKLCNETQKPDWRGWRVWEESHVKAILTYKSKRENM